MPLAERQHDFGLALLDAKRLAPEGLVGPDGQPSPRRFDVYRNNVVAGLIAALGEAYPVVLRLVGLEFFRAMAAAYVTRRPPQSHRSILNRSLRRPAPTTRGAPTD